MFLHIIDRQTAKDAGLKYYFTGLRCKRGNFSERTVSDRKCRCLDCKRVKSNRDKKYRQNNKEYIAETKKAYYQLNKRHELDRSRLWKIKNKDRQKELERNWRIKNKNKEAERLKRYAKDYPDRIKAYRQKSYQNNKEKMLCLKRRYYRRNLDKYRAYNHRRRVAKLNASPCWREELDNFVFQEAYRLSRLRSKLMGFLWHVDHMIPLQAKNVCGLHVWNNFQVIPAKINASKQNSLIYTQHHEWLTDIPKFFNVITA